MRPLRKLFLAQDGVALPVVMGAMMIVTLLAVAAAQSASSVNDSAVRDQNTKRALGAAEAGLHVANNRLNNAPLTTVCLVGTQSGADCPAPTDGDLGNSASYRYWVSPPLASTDLGCVPRAAASQTRTERCITAVGTANGVSRRLQTRVVNLPGTRSYLPVPGMVGLKGIYIGGNSTISGHTGTNGVLEANNGLTARGVTLGPSAATQGRFGYTQDPRAPVRLAEPMALDPVPVGDTSLTNMNSHMTFSGALTYDAARRDLYVNGGTVTLTRSGDYNLCRLRFGASSQIRLAAGVKARLFIDAPGEVRPGSPPAGSGCPSGDGWGEIHAENEVSLNYPGVAENLQLMVVGWPLESAYGQRWGAPTIYFKNKVFMYGLLYAPDSDVTFLNNVEITGGIGASRIRFDNTVASFTWSEDSAKADAESTVYGRSRWRECRGPQPTSSTDPESGC